MKKASLTAIYSALKDTDFDAEILAELNKEIHKGDEQAQATRDLYEKAKPIVFGIMAREGKPLTIADLYEEVKGDLPEDFTKGKLQRGLTVTWKDEVEKTEGKVNSYALKA